MPAPAAQRSRSSTSTLAEADAHAGGDFLRKSGVLYQKAGLGRWRLRYFSLEGTVLYCYRREGDSTAKSFLVLSDCRVSATKDKKLSSFRISDPKTSRVHDLAAASPTVAQSWMDVLAEASEKARLAAEKTQAAEALAKPQDEQEREERPSDANGSVVGFPAVPAQYSEIIEAGIASMDAEMNDEAAWSFAWEKDGVRAHTKVDGSLTAARGAGFLPFPPRAILELVTDATRRKLIDPSLEVGEQLQALDSQTNIDYYRFNGMLVLAKRDFCVLTHWRVLPDGTILVVGQSVEDPVLCPSNEPKIVRGHIHLVCAKIVPNEAYDGADLSFMVKLDLKGRIPARVAGKAASDQPMMILHIGEVLQKSTDLQKLAARGRVVNTLLERPSRHKKRAVSFTSSPSRRASADIDDPSYRSKARTTRASLKSIVKPQPSVFEQSAVVHLSGMQRSTVSSVLVRAVQFGCVALALSMAELPVKLSSIALTLLVLLYTLQSLLGSTLTLPQPKKLTLATLQLDVSKTKVLVGEQRQAADNQLTVAHVLVRALAEALAETSAALGTTYASCLVVMSASKEVRIYEVSKLAKMNWQTICACVPSDTTELQVVKNARGFSWKGAASMLCALGACGVGAAPWMEEKSCTFDSCVSIVVVLAVLSLGLASASSYPQSPMLITIGASGDKPVAVGGKVEVRPMMTLTTTIDHRCVKNSEAEQVFRTFKQRIEGLNCLEPAADAC